MPTCTVTLRQGMPVLQDVLLQSEVDTLCLRSGGDCGQHPSREMKGAL